MTEKNLFKYYPVLFKGLNENGQSSSFFEEIHALISDYAQITVQSSVSCCNFLFISIVSVQWPMVGRPAWCHILSEKMFRLFHRTPLISTCLEIRFEIRKKECPQRRVKDSKGILIFLFLIQVLLKQLNSYIFRQILSFNVIMTSSQKLKKNDFSRQQLSGAIFYHVNDFFEKLSSYAVE